MVDLETDTDRRNGVTFVRAVVTNDRDTPQVVRLRNRLDGPVWPPRVGSITDPAWSDGTWERPVDAGRRVGLGYATPAPPREDGDSLELVSTTRTSPDRDETPEEVLVSLDEWAPDRSVSDQYR